MTASYSGYIPLKICGGPHVVGLSWDESLEVGKVGATAEAREASRDQCLAV